MKWIELFAGGGGVAEGLKHTSHAVLAAIEKEPKIAACYAANHPQTRLIVSDIRDVAITSLPNDITALWASPVCKQDSKARNKALAPREDAAIGRAIVPFIKKIQPELIMIENVAQYENNPSFAIILACLLKERYTVDYRVLNFANYGVPQSRMRLILQARRGPIAWPNHTALRTWYAALEDLFPGMEESDLANWQKALWKPEYDALRPLMVYGHYDFRDERNPAKRLDLTAAHQVARTVTASHNNTHRRIVLGSGRILRMTPRESARLQTFPDTYIWPAQVTLASQIIGNAVPPLMVQKLTELYQREQKMESVA